VVGSDDIPVASVDGKGAVVNWYQVFNSSRTTGAELCLVLRCIPGGPPRPALPVPVASAHGPC
jgi:hypothetical protein